MISTYPVIAAHLVMMVAPRILLLGLLCLYFTMPNEKHQNELINSYDDEKHQQDCVKELVNSYKVVVNATWAGKVVPNIDNKAYVITLVKYICDDTANTLLVGGPKDSGKTMGLVFVLRAAKRIGYPVFELNLKGSMDEQSVKRVMEDFSWQFTEFLKTLEIVVS